MAESFLANISSFIANLIAAWGYVGLFVLIAISSINIPLPSEVILPTSGFLASIGRMNLGLVIVVGVLGDLTGAILSYFLASRLDGRLRQSKDFLIANRWFNRFGEVSILIGRVVPVVRSFIALPAGIFRVKLWRFILLSLAGSIVWVTALSSLGFALGANWSKLDPYFKKFNYLILILVIAGLIWLIKRRFSHRQENSHE